MQNDAAELAGMVVQGCLYGVFLVLTILTLYVLISKRRGGPLNLPFIITSLLMFGLATAQIIVNTSILFQAFLSDFDRPHRQAWLLDLTNPIIAAKRAIFFSMMILGDFIAIYRCFIVWSRNWWLIAFPTVCAVASAVLCYMSMWATRHPDVPLGNWIIHQPSQWGLATFILSLVSNAFATSFVAYRIWAVETHFRRNATSRFPTSSFRNKDYKSTDSSRTRGYSPERPLSPLPAPATSLKKSKPRRHWLRRTHTSGRSNLLPIARIVIESGLLNVIYLIAYIIMLQIEKGGRGPVPIIIDMATPLVGIIFSLVIVRSGIVTSDHVPTPPRTYDLSGSLGQSLGSLHFPHRGQLSGPRAEMPRDEERSAIDTTRSAYTPLEFAPNRTQSSGGGRESMRSEDEESYRSV